MRSQFYRAFFVICALFGACSFVGAETSSVPIVLISIDGLKPDYVLEADKHALKIPNLRRLMTAGVYADGVTGVLPTVTYPSHTTILTGVSPARHGIFNNRHFDPMLENLDGWYWYAEDVRVPTLWDAASETGLVTASVDWPVSVGANIGHNIVQYWRAANEHDRKIIRALSTPGLLTETEAALGPYPRGYDYTVEADRRRSEFVKYILTRKKPRFMSVYFSGLDEVEHETGPYSADAFEALEVIDGLVGEIREVAEVLGQGRAVICVVSDHGFVPTTKELHVNAAFQKAGLIQLDEEGTVVSWDAHAWYAGGSVAVVLRNPHDELIHRRAQQVLEELVADPGYGVYHLLHESEIRTRGGFPNASFVLGLKEGYRMGKALTGPVLREGALEGEHGHPREIAAMAASFFLAGEGVPKRGSLGRIDLRDVAPTLAALLGVSLPEAEGKNLLAVR